MARGVARKGQGKGASMKKPKASKSKAAKRTGPSKRTRAQRDAISKRAAKWRPGAKAKADRRDARAEKQAMRAMRKVKAMASVVRKLQPIAPLLAPLVTPPRSEAERVKAADAQVKATRHGSPTAPTIAIDKIIIGKRHRKDFGDLKALAQSIDDRGGLIQPIALKPNLELIAGERRIRAWQLSSFGGQPIPFHILDVDAIIAGEWDENAQRKDFTPTEAVKIKRTLEDVMSKIRAARPKGEKAAPGRRASGEAAGRVDDKVGRLTGIKRQSLRKAEAVVEAAEQDQERYGDLVDEMNRTGKVNSAHKKLQVREAKRKINDAPPALPMNAKECATWSIDFPWAGEPDRDQASLDAAGRSFRPYPEMSHKTICAFARDQIAPNLPEVVSVWLWVTNFHLVRDYVHHVIAALGFKPENASTMLTWDKVDLGRGQILRDQTEHAILLTRGKPTIDVFGENPPTTLIREPRRENSRKPDAFYRLVERVTPAKRYASIFSQGGEGENWDGHGDQVGKFAPAIARAAEAELIAEAKDDRPDAPEGHRVVMSADDGFSIATCQCSWMRRVKRTDANVAKLDQHVVTHWNEVRPVVEKSKPGMVFTIRTCGDQGKHHAPLGHYLSLVVERGGRQHTCCECGEAFSVVEVHETPKQEAEIVAHWAAVSPPAPDVEEPQQVDLEEAIAARPQAPAGETEGIPTFLKEKRFGTAA